MDVLLLLPFNYVGRSPRSILELHRARQWISTGHKNDAYRKEFVI